jgi:hypothetical protein
MVVCDFDKDLFVYLLAEATVYSAESDCYFIFFFLFEYTPGHVYFHSNATHNYNITYCILHEQKWQNLLSSIAGRS